MYWLISLLLACTITATANDTSLHTQNTNNKLVQNISIQDETERFSQTYPFNSNGTIYVSEINGSITIEAWDNQQIQLEYVKVASNRERLNDLDVNIDASLDNFRVKADYKKRNQNWSRGDKLYINYTLRVPRQATLDKITTVNGNISITGMDNQVNASTVNGGITAKELRGALKLSSVNGTVNAELQQVSFNSEIKLSTVNGTVNVYLPGSIDATFKASTVNGNIRNDFGMEVKKSKYGGGSSLNATLGGGSTQVRLSTVNGTIDIKRGGVNL